VPPEVFMARIVNIMLLLAHCFLIYPELFTQFPEVPMSSARRTIKNLAIATGGIVTRIARLYNL
jgi:hypothetical protein